MKAMIIGGGTGEYGKRLASGLVVSSGNAHIFIDACLANINLFPKVGNVLFLTTHGHHDHFDPDHPWKSIYSEDFSDFLDSGEYSLYTTPGVVKYMRWWHGLENTAEMTVFEGKSLLKVIPAAMEERIVFDGFRIYPIHSGHFWWIKGVVERDEAFGFFISSDANLLYLPDFKFSERVLESIKNISEIEGPLDGIILGCPNPDERPTETSHSTLREIVEWTDRMEKEGLLRNAVKILTHRNPNWDGIDVDTGEFVKAENGMEFTIQGRNAQPSFHHGISQKT